MDWQWLLLLLLSLTLAEVENKEIIAQINTKKLMQYVPERFLSMTIDPSSLFIAGKLEEQALKMARGLYPSFVRLGGKATNHLKFGKELFVDNNTITEGQWDGVNEFVRRAGLDLIVSLNPTHRVQGVWDSRDALQLISYSDKNGYNIAWQLGYDTNGNVAPGIDVGRDIVRLRKILDGFQRYAKTPLFGPDLPDIHSIKEANFIRDMLAQAGPVLGAVFLQMPFRTKDDPSTTISNTIMNMENLIWSRELRFGRSIPKKPIWLTEKCPSRGSAEDAISLLKHLGVGARMGCQVILRQVGPESLVSPTPDYWVALMYKNLVGRGVFEARVNPGNRSELTLFSHCTPSLPQEKSILDTGFNYEKGGVTVFGVNESPEAIRLSLKASIKEERAHLYILTFQDDSDGKTEKTFLNGQLLSLSPSGDLPIVSPKIKRTIKYGINVPSKSIFFIVLPDLKARTCSLASPFVNPDVQSLSKKLIHVVSDVFEKPINDELKSEEEDPHKVYVKFSKSTPVQGSSIADHKPLAEDDSEPDVQVKYITFNDNSWLSKLTETMSNNKALEQPIENQNSENQEDKYTAMPNAVTEPINITDNPPTEEETDAKKRRKRSLEDSQLSDQEPTSANHKNVASEEDLVKHLNQYASTIYETSRSDESNKEVQISIPQKILNTLKKVKVTFKNLGKDDSNKETNENSNRNEQPQERRTDEQKDNISLNSYIVNQDGNLEQVQSDPEKTNTYPPQTKNREEDIYREDQENNNGAAKEIIEREQKNVEENSVQESNNRNQISLDAYRISEPFQVKDSYSIPDSQPQTEPSSEVSEKAQGFQLEKEQKYTDLDSGSLQLSSPFKRQVENDEYSSPEKNEDPSEADENFKNDKIILQEDSVSDRKELDSKDSENNIDLKNTEILSPQPQSSLLEPEKNVVLIPIKSTEHADIANFFPGEEIEQQRADVQLTTQTEYNKKEQNTDETNNLEYLSFNHNSILDNAADEPEKLVHIDEKEKKFSDNGVLSEVEYSQGNKGEKTNENKEEGEETLNNEAELISQPLIISEVTNLSSKDNLNPGSSEGTNYLPSSDSLSNENQQQGLQSGPPLPLDSLDSVKVQREIPVSEDISENNEQNIPLVVEPINSESQISSQENKEEIKNEHSSGYFNIDPSKDFNFEVNGSDNSDKNIPDISSNDGDRKDLPESTKDGYLPESPPDRVENANSGAHVVSFGNVPLENTEDKTYIKTPDSSVNDNQEHLSNINNDNQEHLSNINNDLSQEHLSNTDSDLSQEQIKGAIQPSESTSPDYFDKSIEAKDSQNAEIPILIPVTSQETNVPLEKSSYIAEVPHSLEPHVVPLQIPEEKIELDDQSNSQEKNTENLGSTEENNIYRYNLLNKVIPEIENTENKTPHKSDIPKAEIDKERRERLLSLKKQIMEMREQFRAQVKEEGLKAALLRREEGMRQYLNHDKELRKKLITYPIVTQDHNVLSRPRRLSYFPESDLSDEDQYDYIDQKLYQKKPDSYSGPLLGGYDKQFYPQQSISSPYNLDRNHILFPLDPKTPQAVVYDDRIIPAKLFGIISVNGEQPLPINNPTGIHKQNIDVPIDSVYQKYYAKHYNPYINEKPLPRVSDTSLPLDAYPLPRDAYVKTLDEPSNYIPIVVLSSHAKNRRKRSVSENNTNNRKSARDEQKNQNISLKKRSIESSNTLDNNNDSSYDFLNEIPNETENSINSIDYIHPNEIIVQKRDDLNSNQFSKNFLEFLPSNGVPLSFLHSGPNAYNAPMWNDARATHDDTEPRTFLPSHPLPPLPPPPPPSLFVHHDISEQHPERHEDTPKFYFWTIINDKFKAMLGLLQNLAEWCSNSTDK